MSDVEDRLGAYRPAGPPPDLRARILREVEGARRARFWEWLPALATAALAFLFYTLGVHVRSDIASRLSVPDDLRPVEQWATPEDRAKP